MVWPRTRISFSDLVGQCFLLRENSMTSVLAVSKRTAISYAFVTWKLWVLYKEHVIYARAGGWDIAG